MGAAIGQSLPVAVGVLVSPLPIVAVVLMLVSERARANALTEAAGAGMRVGPGGASVEGSTNQTPRPSTRSGR